MSRNPVLNDNAFGESTTDQRPSPAQEWDAAQGAGAARAGAALPNALPPTQAPAPGGPFTPATGGKVMTLGGVSAATLFMFAFLLIGAAWGWGQVTQGTPTIGLDGTSVTPVEFNSPGLLIGCLLGAFVISIVTVFKPKLARFTAIPFALLEGAVLGMISHFYNAQFSGIVIQAILATFGVFLAMLVLYGLRILRATPKFTKGVIAATFGIMVLYLGSFVWGLVTGNSVSFLNDASPLSIGISVIIVIVAALNLILDFDFIERGSKNELPAYMDWYAAFGLVLTLVWLYLEMLRLLSKIRQ